jgi:cation transport ATPase
MDIANEIIKIIKSIIHDQTKWIGILIIIFLVSFTLSKIIKIAETIEARLIYNMEIILFLALIVLTFHSFYEYWSSKSWLEFAMSVFLTLILVCASFISIYLFKNAVGARRRPD